MIYDSLSLSLSRPRWARFSFHFYFFFCTTFSSIYCKSVQGRIRSHARTHSMDRYFVIFERKNSEEHAQAYRTQTKKNTSKSRIGSVVQLRIVLSGLAKKAQVLRIHLLDRTRQIYRYYARQTLVVVETKPQKAYCCCFLVSFCSY